MRIHTHSRTHAHTHTHHIHIHYSHTHTHARTCTNAHTHISARILKHNKLTLSFISHCCTEMCSSVAEFASGTPACEESTTAFKLHYGMLARASQQLSIQFCARTVFWLGNNLVSAFDAEIISLACTLARPFISFSYILIYSNFILL